jgi:hypothetical protein
MSKDQGGFAKAAQPFVCGGSAATFASCIIHPIDLAKVRNNYSRLLFSITEICEKLISPQGE